MRYKVSFCDDHVQTCLCKSLEESNDGVEVDDFESIGMILEDIPTTNEDPKYFITFWFMTLNKWKNMCKLCSFPLSCLSNYYNHSVFMYNLHSSYQTCDQFGTIILYDKQNGKIWI